MEDKQTYNIKEAAKILGIGEVTVRRRVKDKTLDATYVSKKLGYQITKESIDKFAAERATKRKAKPHAAKKTDAKPVKAVKSATKAAAKATKPVATQSVDTDSTTEMLVGGSLGIALSAILGAYSSVGELHLPENSVKKLIKELQSPQVIDKVIERLKAEQEYFDIQVSAQEIKVQQTSKKDEKAVEQQKLIEYRLKKNQIGKDIKDLELRKTLFA
ncbi:MAG: helix-turn-helix domain-containing protein [Selenomonadaceae bacterium]|nr:helix-turn-helix domain-containing protein [Selenomonadaceae bacterium]